MLNSQLLSYSRESLASKLQTTVPNTMDIEDVSKRSSVQCENERAEHESLRYSVFERMFIQQRVPDMYKLLASLEI